MASSSAAAGSGAAGLAFEAGAVAHEGEVAAFAAAVALVALHARRADLLEPVVDRLDHGRLRRHHLGRDFAGEGDRAAHRLGAGRGAALEDGELVAHETLRGDAV